MSSTTQNKKAIVDFLWDWTTNLGEWSKLLIHKIVTTESPLSDAEREKIFNYFLQSIQLYSGLPDLNIDKPTYNPTSDKIELESLSEISGVNRLAKDQTIDFSKNITVIYGENGTGKTGYSRILKNLGFSYDKYETILPNIHEEAKAQSATVSYKANGASKSFTWDGQNTDSQLENISVFNSNCVKFSLADRKLIVSPIGFHLFQLVSEELNRLTELFRFKTADHSTEIAWLDNLRPESPQYNFISSLSAASTEQKLIELSEFNSTHKENLEKMESELANLNKALLQSEIQGMDNQIKELNLIIGSVENSKKTINPKSWQALIKLNNEITELEMQTKSGIKDIATERGIEFYETKEFNSFVQAAESYIKIIDTFDYPNNGDTCIYCLQPLDSSAVKLLRSYRALLNDKTQEKLDALLKEKAKLIQDVQQVETSLILHYPSFGIDDNGAVIQPKEITSYNKSLSDLKIAFTTDASEVNSSFTFDYQDMLDFLIEKRTKINDARTKKLEVFENIATKEAMLKKVINELKDRKYLSLKLAGLRKVIDNHKVKKTLQNKDSVFSTNSISRQTSLARQALIQQNFQDLFEEELIAFKKSNIKIDYVFKTDRGNSKVFQTISNHALADVLSEGEQKAIALAEFLTELQLDNTIAPVIFDDPVNSLDHKIIDQVVKRLIELSKTRQVVVFSHSILLLNSFIQQSKLDHHRQTVDFKFHSVKVNFGVTGVLDDVEEINSFSYYKKKLNNVLNTKMEGQNEATLAAEGYGHLRSAIEVSVERELLKDTITRYGKGVSFPAFLRIDGAKINESKIKLNDIYEKCCVSIEGHSSPEQIQATPTIYELKMDFDEFIKIRKEYKQ